MLNRFKKTFSIELSCSPRRESSVTKTLIWGRGQFLLLIVVVMLAACSGGETAVEVPEVTAAAELVQPENDPDQIEAADLTPTMRPDPPTAEPQLTPTDLPPTEPPPTFTPIPTPTAVPVMVNGLPSSSFIMMSEEVRENVRQIAAAGAETGRNPQAFSILGDSLIATPQSLAKWDEAGYVLGEYAYLQPTIDQYSGSFSRYGVSVRVGLHSWSVFDPLWADKDFCQANEDLLACEIRLNNPSVMFIFLGSNDAGSPGGFNVNYRQVVDSLIAQGIVPIMATKADRFEGADNANNTIIRKIAAEYKLPLMEFDILADTLPGRGLGADNIHLTYLEPLDYSAEQIFGVGYPVHNLASLMILNEVRQAIAVGDN